MFNDYTKYTGCTTYKDRCMFLLVNKPGNVNKRALTSRGVHTVGWWCSWVGLCIRGMSVVT